MSHLNRTQNSQLSGRLAQVGVLILILIQNYIVSIMLKHRSVIPHALNKTLFHNEVYGFLLVYYNKRPARHASRACRGVAGGALGTRSSEATNPWFLSL